MAAQKLNFKKIRRSASNIIDPDYLDKLSPSELEWLQEAYAAIYYVAGPLVEEVAKTATYQTNGRNRGEESYEKTGRQALNSEKWARESDVFYVLHVWRDSTEEDAIREKI